MIFYLSFLSELLILSMLGNCRLLSPKNALEPFKDSWLGFVIEWRTFLCRGVILQISVERTVLVVCSRLLFLCVWVEIVDVYHARSVSECLSTFFKSALQPVFCHLFTRTRLFFYFFCYIWGCVACNLSTRERVNRFTTVSSLLIVPWPGTSLHRSSRTSSRIYLSRLDRK